MSFKKKNRIDHAKKALGLGFGLGFVFAPFACDISYGETIFGAMARAYSGNPELNSERATTRATDEGVPQAMAGYRPKVSGNVSAGVNGIGQKNTPNGKETDNTSYPRTYGLTVSQTLWNGNQTTNSVIQAESKVLGQREALRNTEQNLLSDAATYYMDVLQNTAILALNKNNIQVLEEQLRQTRDRFRVGEVTRTDVAQAEADLANANTQYYAAQSTLQTSIANYRQVIGDMPNRLEPAQPLDKLLPKTLEEAIRISQVEHPSIQAMLHGVDAAEVQVKIVEGQLYPTVTLNGSLTRAYDSSATTKSGDSLWNGVVTAGLSIPIYEGGAVYSQARQAKESLGATQLQVDLQRDKVRANVVSAWGSVLSSRQAIQSTQATVTAAEIALNGVREEAKVGQRTTLDVLNAQQTLLTARVQLVKAQHDRVVYSYTLMSTIGRLSVASLGIKTERYDPVTHFDQVKDKWIGLRTPDGR